MTTLSEEFAQELMALADGELDEVRSARVLAAIAHDVEAQERLALYRQTRAVLQVYDSLAVPSIRDRQIVERATRPRSNAQRSRLPLALAASLLAAAGLLALLRASLPADPATFLAPTWSNALEAAPAGALAPVTYAGRTVSLTPLDTYAAADGRFCRSFLLSDEVRDLAEGFACRDEAARWRGEIVVASPHVANASTPAQDFSPASKEAELSALIRHAHGPLSRLSSTDTQRLLDAHWKTSTTRKNK